MAGKFSLEAIFRGNDQISKTIAGIEGKTRGFSKNLNKLNEINSKIAGGFAEVAKQAAVAGAAVGAIGIGAALNVGSAGADFEEAISGIAAVSLTTVDKVEDLRLKALELAQAGKYSATEIAHGMEELGRAGLNSQEIMQGIGPILAAATAEGAEFNETAANVTSIIKGMGLGFDQTARVADVLTVASAATKSSINSLGESMAILAPTARQLKVPLEDAVAMVASLQDVGLDASVAGSAVVSMLNGMAKPSAEIAAKMRAMGVSFRTASGDMIAPQLVLEQLVKAGKKAGGSLDQVAFFEDLVGLRGQKAALNLKDLFVSGKYQELTKNLGDVAGKAQQMADTKMDNLKGDLTTLDNVVGTLKIGLFDLEKGPLRGVTRGVKDWVVANRELVISDTEKFINDLADALPKIAMWAGRIGRAALVLGAFALAVKLAAGAVALFNLVSEANPWTLLALGLLALTTLLIAFLPEAKKHWEILGALALVAGVLVVALKGQAMWVGITTGLSKAAAFATGLYATAMDGAAVAAGVMDAGLLPLLLTILAISVAVGAVYVAFKKFTELLSVSGGWEGLKSGLGEWAKDPSMKGLFKGIDNYQNAQAKAGNPAAKADAPAAPGTDQLALLQSLLAPKGPAPSGVGMPAIPSIPGMPALPGMPAGQDPQALIAALMAQQAGLPGATSAKGQAPAQSAKETGESLAKAMGPALTEALKKGKGLITVTVKGGKGEVEQQPESGFELLMSPSGGF